MIWKFPFRYFKELRAAYLTSLSPLKVSNDDDDSVDFRSPDAAERVIDYDQEIFKGDSL